MISAPMVALNVNRLWFGLAILNRFSVILLHSDSTQVCVSRCGKSGDFRPAALGIIVRFAQFAIRRAAKVQTERGLGRLWDSAFKNVLFYRTHEATNLKAIPVGSKTTRVSWTSYPKLGASSLEGGQEACYMKKQKDALKGPVETPQNIKVGQQ